MSNDTINQLLLFSTEALTTAFLLLGLFRMRSRLSLSPLYVTLGVFQPIQVLLASSIYVEVLPGLEISPGSVIMFTASLFTILLVYIREDAIKAREVIYGIVVANLTMTLLLFVFGVQLGFPDTLNFLGLPRELFNQGARVMLAGTIALLGDVVLVIFVYEAVRRFIPRVPFLRIYLTMVTILTFDTLVFATGAFYGQPNYRTIVLSGIVGKAGMAVFYAAALTIYLRFIEPADRVSLATVQPFRDIFYALTYREKYEIERERAKEMLRESKEQFRLAFENANIGMCLVDLDGRLTRVNQQMSEIFGYDQKELESMNVNDIAHPEDADISPQFIQRAASGEIEHTQFEKRYFHKRGPIVWGQVSSSLVRDFQGAPLYFISHVQDITERVRAEQALRESEERLRTAGKAAYDLIYEWDVTSDTLEWFGDVDGLLGYGKGEISRDINAWLDLIHPKDRGKLENAVELHRTSTQPIQYEYRVGHKDGTYRHWNDHALPLLDDKGPYKWVGVCTDITERVRAEERLRLLSSAVEQSTEGLAVSDLEGNLLSVNNAFATMHGYNPEELVGKHLSIFHTPEQMPPVEAANRQIQETGEFGGEIWHVRRDATVFPTLMHNSLLRDEAGNPTGMIGTLRDVTERVRAEKELKQRLRELERFNALTVDRELRMIELKKEINALLKRAGQSEKYRIVE